MWTKLAFDISPSHGHFYIEIDLFHLAAQVASELNKKLEAKVDFLRKDRKSMGSLEIFHQFHPKETPNEKELTVHQQSTFISGQLLNYTIQVMQVQLALATPFWLTQFGNHFQLNFAAHLPN